MLNVFVWLFVTVLMQIYNGKEQAEKEKLQNVVSGEKKQHEVYTD